MRATRREMIRLGLGSSALLAWGKTVPGFLAKSAMAMNTPGVAANKGRVLVVVQLNGGNDGLNTVVPYRDDEYRKQRPTIQVVANEVKTIDDHIGFHPQLAPFTKLLEAHQLAIVQSVGYPNPNRSHFESMAIWQTGQSAPDARTPGWLARAIDDRVESEGGDMQGLHIHESAALARSLQGGRNVIPSIAKLEQFQRRLGVPAASNPTGQAEVLDQLSHQGYGDAGSLLQFVERCSLMTYASSARLERVRIEEGKNAAATNFPDFYGLARRLRSISQLIKAELSTPIYYTQLDGFDTHSGQIQSHASLMRELGVSLEAFLKEIDAAGVSDRVLVLVFSEFGRRLGENGSGGTDHGTAAPVFILGKPVKAGVSGPYPDLTHLDDEGDPRHAIDFRRVYASVLDGWLGVSASQVLGARFDPMPLLQG